MKYFVYWFLVLGIITSCSQDDLPALRVAHFNEDFQVGLGEKIVVLNSNERSDSLFIEVKAIEDNRCPKDVKCYRYGYAKISLSIFNEHNSESLEMCIGVCHSAIEEATSRETRYIDTTSLDLGGKQYILYLKKVVPYPEMNDKKTQEKQAVLQVVN